MEPFKDDELARGTAIDTVEEELKDVPIAEQNMDMSRVASSNDLLSHEAERAKRGLHLPSLSHLTQKLKRKSVTEARSGHERWKKPEPPPSQLKINCTRVQTNDVISISLQELCDMRISLNNPDQEVIWIDIESPTESDMKYIEAKFGLHPLTTEDILNTSTDAREKAEAFEHYLFVVTKEMGYREGSNILVVYNINVVVFPRVVFSVHPSHVSSVSMVYHRISLETAAHRTKQDLSTPDWVMYAIVDAVTDMYVHHVNGLTIEGENLNEIVLTFSADEREDVLRRIGLARQFITNLQSHLRAKRELVTYFLNKESPFVSKNTKVYVRDIMDHTLSMEEKLRVTQEILGYATTTYLARGSIEAAEAANKINGIMKRFGVVATLFLPMNLLAGSFGMNVKVPFQDEDNLVPFLGIVCFMAFLVMSLLILFWRKKWI